MPPISNLTALAFPALPHDLCVTLASGRTQEPKPSIEAQARAQAIISLRPEGRAGGQDVLPAEAAEDARPAAALKLHAPWQTTPPTTVTPLAQKMSVMAAASRSTYNGFCPN